MSQCRVGGGSRTRRPHRSGREPLGSSGSCRPVVSAQYRSAQCAKRPGARVRTLVFRSFLALSLVVGRGDTPVTRGSWILDGEEDSIDRSFTVLMGVVRRCLPAPSPRARWPVCWPSSAYASLPPPSRPSSDWLLV